jgi:transposase
MLENDSNTLRERYRNCKDAKEKTQHMTLYAASRGFSVAEAAKFVDVEESTAYDWIKKWVTEESVSDKPRSGRPPSITKEDEEENETSYRRKRYEETWDKCHVIYDRRALGIFHEVPFQVHRRRDITPIFFISNHYLKSIPSLFCHNQCM